MIHRLTEVIALTVLIAIAAGLLFAPAVSAQEQNSAIEDGQIVQCGMISEDGNYEVSRDFEHDGSNICLNVTANSVTIEDGTLRGDRDSSVGIRAGGDYDGQITLRNVQMVHWGESALSNQWNGQRFVVENSEFDTNTHIYLGTEGGGLEMSDSEVRDTYSRAIGSQRMGDIIIHDSTFTNGGGPAIGTIDGANIEIRGSEFTGHDGTPLSFAHSTRAEIHNTDISENGGNGMNVQTTGHTVKVEVNDATITNNDGHGVNAFPFRGFDSTLTLHNTEIDDNGGLAVRSHKDSEPNNEQGISASNLDLGGGVVVDFENLMLNLSTEAAHDHDTDALVFEAPADADIEAEFSTGTDSGALWAQMDDGWQQRGTYDSGTFTEVIGPDTWAASGSAPSTPEPTPTPTPPPNNTPEPTDEPTDEPADGPVSGQESTPTETPTNSQPVVMPQPQRTPTETDEPSNPDTDTPTETEPGEATTETEAETTEPTENGTSAPATETATTGGDDGEPSGDSGSSWQVYGISMAIILLLATLTASLVSWE